MQRRRVQWREDGAPVHGAVEVVDLARRLARRGMVQTGVVHVADHTLEPGQHASGRHGLVWIVTCESVRIRWRKKTVSVSEAPVRGLVLTLAFVEGLAGGPHPHQYQEEEERPEHFDNQPHLQRTEPHHFLPVSGGRGAAAEAGLAGKPRRPRVSGVSRAFALSTYGIYESRLC